MLQAAVVVAVILPLVIVKAAVESEYLVKEVMVVEVKEDLVVETDPIMVLAVLMVVAVVLMMTILIDPAVPVVKVPEELFGVTVESIHQQILPMYKLNN
jgi:hypothetical protein